MKASESLTMLGYDTESYQNQYQASRGLFISEWFNSYEELLDAMIAREKSQERVF